MLSQDRSTESADELSADELPTAALPTTAAESMQSSRASSVSPTALLASTLRQALVACEQENWAETIAVCRQAIALCQQNLTNQNLTNQNLADQHANQTNSAVEAEKTTENQPGSAPENLSEADATAAQMYRAKAVLCQQQGLVSEAIAALKSAIGHHTQSVDLHVSIATLYAKQQQWSEAVRHYQRAALLMATYQNSQTPASQDQNHPGQNNPTQNNPSQNSQNAQTIKRALAEALFNLAEQLKTQGDITGAVRAYLKALQHQPLLYKAYNRLRYNLMRYDIADNDPILNEIVSVCQQNIAQYPELQSACVALGYALTKLNRLDEARDRYRIASDFMTVRQLKATAAGAGDISDGNPNLSPHISPQRLGPSFMVIGAEKCGTTSLYQYLAYHPQVLASVEKEIDFFDMEYSRGLDWYLAHFPAQPISPPISSPAAQRDAQPDSPLTPEAHWISGETSANYLYSDAAPQRVFEQFPQLQLIVLLRHPVDRTISRYNMMVRNGAEKRSFEQAITEEIQLIEQAQADFQSGSQKDIHRDIQPDTPTEADIPWSVLNRCRHVGNSLYYYHLQRWLTYFSLDQLLILRSEDLFAQPEQTLRTLCQTLEISPPPEQTYDAYNTGKYDAASEAIRQRLFDFYQPHTRKLETLLKRSFDWTHASF